MNPHCVRVVVLTPREQDLPLVQTHIAVRVEFEPGHGGLSQERGVPIWVATLCSVQVLTITTYRQILDSEEVGWDGVRTRVRVRP